MGALTAAKVLSAFWATFKSVLPCLATLPCLQADLTFEGVPSFEDALMTDKLVGARTYEMRDMPKYRDFFFESKSPATTPKRKTAGGAFAENDAGGRGGFSDSDSDDSVSLGDVSMLLHSAGPGGTGSVAGSPLGGGFGAGAGGGLRVAYAAADWNGGNGEKHFFLKNAAATENSNRLDADGGGPLTPLTGVNGSLASRGGRRRRRRCGGDARRRGGRRRREAQKQKTSARSETRASPRRIL